MSVIRVLVCDDDAEIRSALAAIISSAPELELVGTAETVRQVVLLTRQHRPHVVLVDVKMPDGGGPQAVRSIKEVSRQTRVVAFSAHDDRASVLQMLRAGADSYLVKGAKIEEIRTALVNAAHGKSMLSPSVTGEIIHELTDQLEHVAQLEDEQREQVRRIRKALEPGTVEIVFQPIVELDGRATIGFEALARFLLQPQRPPNEWFAEAKAVELDVPLEAAVVQLAIASITRLPPDSFLTLNIDPNNLTSPSILTLLDIAQINRIVVEVTEHTPVQDYTELTAALLELRTKGLRVAVDDAGAGYASLRHIARLAPDMLKIDASLTRALDSDRTTRALVAAFVAFANETQTIVIAEGIENDHVAEHLSRLGVRYGQGYALGRPVPLGQPDREPAARV